MEESILQLFPLEQRNFWKMTAQKQHCLQEIRLRVDRPIILYMDGRERFLNVQGAPVEQSDKAVCMDRQGLEAILKNICQDSFYAFEDELKQGFLTAAGGHRIGISGQAVLDETGKLKTIKNISFVNIRVAHQVKNAADKILPFVYHHGVPQNTLILAPPGCGKTTLLRDLIRQVSDGNAFGVGQTVGVVDERSELAGSFLGVPQNDLGIRTDVLDACPKSEGMLLLLRSMSPQVIAIDELGSIEEMGALRRAAACGCRILATAHGQTLEDVEKRFGIKAEEYKKMFQVILCLQRRGEIFLAEPLWGKETAYAENDRGSDDDDRMFGIGNMVSQPIPWKSKILTDTTANIGSVGERGTLWESHVEGMLPTYAKAASGTFSELF